MSKGKSGIALTAIAAVAFVLALLEWSTLLILVLGFALVVEKDQWLNKQVVKAFYLVIGYNLVTYLIRELFDLIMMTIGRLPFIGGVFDFIEGIVLFALMAIYIIITGLAAFKVSKGEDAVVPVIDKLADDTFEAVNK
ncbi:MAG: hypothetical protein ACRCWY_14455 [Cellulosilyticaceae bacterium]